MLAHKTQFCFLLYVLVLHNCLVVYWYQNVSIIFVPQSPSWKEHESFLLVDISNDVPFSFFLMTLDNSSQKLHDMLMELSWHSSYARWKVLPVCLYDLINGNPVAEILWHFLEYLLCLGDQVTRVLSFIFNWAFVWLIYAAHADSGFNLIVVDPPWENASAHQKSRYIKSHTMFCLRNLYIISNLSKYYNLQLFVQLFPA